MSVNIQLEIGLCCGFGNCAEVCPEVFTLDAELGKAKLLTSEVPENLLERAREAVTECPTQAIVIE